MPPRGSLCWWRWRGWGLRMATTLRTVARSQVRRQKLRFAMTALGIGIAAFFLSAVLILAQSLTGSVQQAVADGYSRADAVLQNSAARTYNPADSWSLTPEQIEKVESSDLVKSSWVQYLVSSSLTTLSDSTPVALHFTGLSLPKSPELFPFNFTGSYPSSDTEIMLSSYLAETHELEIGDTFSTTDWNQAASTPVDSELKLPEHEVTLTAIFDVSSGMSASAQNLYIGGTSLADYHRTSAESRYVEARTALVNFTDSAHLQQGAALSALRTELTQVEGPAFSLVAVDEQIQFEVKQNTVGFKALLYGVLSFVALALLMASFVIANTFRVMTVQRSKELALLRVLGARRGDLIRMLLGEALLLGVLAATVGAGLTYLLAFIAKLTVSGMVVVISPLPALTAIAVCALVTTLSSLLPALRAYRITPLQALSTQAQVRDSQNKLPKSILVFGVLLVLAGTVLALLGISQKISGAVTLAVFMFALAAIFLVPLALSPALAALAKVTRPYSIGHLAQSNAAGSPVATAATGRMLFICSALIAALLTGFTSMQYSILTDIEKDMPFAVEAPTDSSPEKVKEQVLELAEVEGIKSVAFGLPQAQVRVDPSGINSAETVTVLAIDPAGLQAVGPSTADLSLPDNTVLLGNSYAERLGWQDGQEITLTGTEGNQLTVNVKVISPNLHHAFINTATGQQLSGNSILSSDGEPLAPYVFASVDDKAYDRVLAEAVTQAEQVLGIENEYELSGYLQIRQETKNNLTVFLNVVLVLLAAALLIALVGVANTQVLNSHQRRRAYALLRSVGISRSALRKVITVETTLIAALAILLGVGAGILDAMLLLQVFAIEDLPLVYSIDWGMLAAILPAGVAVAWLTAYIPAVRASKVSPVEALRDAS